MNLAIFALSFVYSYSRKQKTADWSDDLPPEVLDELIQSIEESENEVFGTTNEEMLRAARNDFPNLEI